MANQDRKFLFLQGPHGPFFGQVAQRLRATGAGVARVGFNRGDQHFWPRGLPYTAYGPQMGDFSAFLRGYIAATWFFMATAARTMQQHAPWQAALA